MQGLVRNRGTYPADAMVIKENMADMVTAAPYTVTLIPMVSPYVMAKGIVSVPTINPTAALANTLVQIVETKQISSMNTGKGSPVKMGSINALSQPRTPSSGLASMPPITLKMHTARTMPQEMLLRKVCSSFSSGLPSSRRRKKITSAKMNQVHWSKVESACPRGLSAGRKAMTTE